MKKSAGCLLLLFALASKNVLAQGNLVYTALSPADPLAPAYLFNGNNSVGHGLQKRDQHADQLSPRMTFISDPATWSRDTILALAKTTDCNLDAMLALPDSSAVVNYLKTHSNSCIRFLWSYSPNMNDLFTTHNLTAVLNEISHISTQYVGDDTQNINELLTFVRIAYFQNFYHHLHFNKPELKPIVVSALNMLFANQHIFDSSNAAGEILDTVFNTIDATETDTEMLPHFESTLQIFLDQMPKRLQQSNQQSAIFSVFYTLSRSIYNKVLTQVDASLLSLLKSYALLTLDEKYDFILTNTMWTLGRIMNDIPDWSYTACANLESGYHFQPKWSTPWLWAVKSLTVGHDCKILNSGEKVCLSEVRADLKKYLFPNTYRFENGLIQVHTSLSLTDVEPLYYATKEVKTQFGRVVGHLTPVPNDPNEVLKIVIYSSPNEYAKYHTFLYDLDSNNGGIYIEQDGTYYTYQRKPSESIYTLQELARHEYTHYLVGRYLVEGMWGQVPLYDHNRMVFFDEGVAEFFAGSTPRDDVALRLSLIKQIKNDKSSRLAIADILTSTYDSFKFYRYAGTFFHFLYQKHLDIFKNFITHVNKSDTAGFDNLVFQLKSDKNLNKEYQNYLDWAIANIGQIGIPTTVAPQASELTYTDPAQIARILEGTGSVHQPVCKLGANQTNLLFNCQGQITGPAMSSQDSIQGWYVMNQTVNEFVKASSSTGANLNWMNCWFGSIQWDANNASSYVPRVEYYCDGPLGKTIV